MSLQGKVLSWLYQNFSRGVTRNAFNFTEVRIMCRLSIFNVNENSILYNIYSYIRFLQSLPL